jgi:hypothetical protein
VATALSATTATLTDARTFWPRCQRVGVRGGSGLLVDEELLRAIRSESSLALQYWFGVNEATVWKWRRAFGIAQWGTEGSRRLHAGTSERGAAKLRGKKLPKALVKRGIKIRAANGFKMPKRWAKSGWQQWQLDLLGTAPDTDLAARFGRSENAVRVMRWRIGRRAPATR